jgi:solute carrier family 25 (mitochondrial aspartate/glutamate transporter), member 12/13
MELAKVRLQVQADLPPEQRVTSFIGVMRQIGVKNLFQGASACFLRDIPYAAIYYGVYDASKRHLQALHGGSPLAWHNFVAGMIGGSIASWVTTPSDVIKTRLQVQRKEAGTGNAEGKKLPGLVDTFSDVIRNEGVRGLFKGSVPRVLRSGPQYGVMLLTYEVMKKVLV